MDQQTLKNDMDQLMDTALSFRESAALFGAVKLDLFDRIGPDWTTVNEVADGEDLDGLTRLCRVLSGLDLIKWDDGRLRNTEGTEQLLTSRGDVDLRPILRHFTELYEIWGGLDEAIGADQSYEFDRGDEEQFSESFTEAMEARAYFAKDELVGVIGDRLDGGRLLDLGGGSGVFARALLNHDRRATGVVADRPEPLAVADRYIRDSNLADRLETRELDLFEDDEYGTDFDMVLVSAILHIFGPDDARLILNRVYSALAPDGIVVVRDYVVDDEDSNSLDALLFNMLMYLVTEQGQTYTHNQLRSMLKEAGFSSLERIPLNQSTDDLLVGQKK